MVCAVHDFGGRLLLPVQVAAEPAEEAQQQPIEETPQDDVAEAAGQAEAAFPEAEAAEEEPTKARSDGEGQAVQTKQGRGNAKGRGDASKAKSGKADAATASASADADKNTTGEAAADTQPGNKPARGAAKAKQAEHSVYSFPESTPQDDYLSIQSEELAPRASIPIGRLRGNKAQQDPVQAVPEAAEEPEAAGEQAEDEPGHEIADEARGRRAGKGTKGKGRAAAGATAAGKQAAAAAEVTGQPNEKPARASGRWTKKTAKVAEAEAEAGSDVQEEADPTDAPPGRPARGRKTAAAQGKGKADSAEEQLAPKAKHRLSRATRAAEKKAEEPDQEGTAGASAAGQAKRGRAKRAQDAQQEAEEDRDRAKSGKTDSSAKQLAALTESQAAADTLAKVGLRFAPATNSQW